MTATDKQAPEKAGEKAAAEIATSPFDRLRTQINRLFEDFDGGALRMPFSRSPFDADSFWRRELNWNAVPVVDIDEKDAAFEISAELPGIDQNDIEIALADGVLTIKGEKTQEKTENKKNVHLSERHYGSFERSFRVPDGVDTEKIAARFDKGVLTVTLPKLPEPPPKPQKKISIDAG